MVYRLQDIQSTVQQTAEAIAEVLKIEVEIADSNLFRIAGTGKYQNQCGEKMADGHVYQHVMTTGQVVVIENPGEHLLCKPCRRWGNCFEGAEVASPICVDGQPVGVIGLIGFETEQTVRLLQNQDSLLRFLEKMADLIAGKVVEFVQHQQREVLTTQLEMVLNLLSEGILVVDGLGTVTRFNEQAEKMLDVGHGLPFNLDQLLEVGQIWPLIKNGESFSGQIAGKGKNGRFFCNVFPITTEKTMEGAVITLRDLQQIRNLVKDATVQEVETNFSQILGRSKKMQALKETALRVARSNATVLIRGESGTGKEMFARAIHQSSQRQNHPFIAINCGAIPENLLESELFGYEEGSFTGAKKGGKLGKFELAHLGTIFLDEIGDMSLHLQVKLLRVLQEKAIEKIGGTSTVPIDVRVIAATNRDLETMIRTGEFREDLYYRLNVIPLTILSLRERREDIPVLTRYFIDYYSKLLGKEPMHITSEAQKVLDQYNWPGNVRELSNVIEFTVTMGTGDIIETDMLPVRVKNKKQEGLAIRTLNLKELEREALLHVLRESGNDAKGKETAAKLLGISRATLYRKIKEHDIMVQTEFF